MRRRTADGGGGPGRIGVLAAGMAMVAIAAVGVVPEGVAAHDERAPETAGRLHEAPAAADGVPTLTAVLKPHAGRGMGGGGGVAGACPPVQQTYTDPFPVQGQPFEAVAQAGFAEGETAALSFAVPAEDFPLVVRTMEILFVQTHFNETTTEWTLRVWEGNPDTGSEEATFSSDDVILPHVTLPFKDSNGVIVQVQVDPGDPDQILLNGDGSNIVSLGFRIDQHNNQTGSGCNAGDIPANSNAFPATDQDGLDEPTRNWIHAINCGPFGCVPNGGWDTFQGLPGACTPSGDWIIRITYEPQICLPGACCLPDGTCQNDVEASDCADSDGIFQGSQTVCDGSCPEPMGACCFPGPVSTCEEDHTEKTCATEGGLWQGAGSDCGSPCVTEGACCFEGGSCADLTEADCAAADGFYQGLGVLCDDIDCFPMGACCMPDGACADDMSPENCEAAGGIFQGNDSACPIECPQPQGACCLSNGNCIFIEQADCNDIPDASWAGFGTDCTDADKNDTADDCEACAGDVDHDGDVDVDDLTEVILGWGCDTECAADVDNDGDVDVDDLTEVILNWGCV